LPHNHHPSSNPCRMHNQTVARCTTKPIFNHCQSCLSLCLHPLCQPAQPPLPAPAAANAPSSPLTAAFKGATYYGSSSAYTRCVFTILLAPPQVCSGAPPSPPPPLPPLLCPPPLCPPSPPLSLPPSSGPPSNPAHSPSRALTPHVLLEPAVSPTAPFAAGSTPATRTLILTSPPPPKNIMKKASLSLHRKGSGTQQANRLCLRPLLASYLAADSTTKPLPPPPLRHA
jgi:hypothetical protein